MHLLKKFSFKSNLLTNERTICDSLYDEQFQKNSYFKVFKIFDSPFPVYRELHFGHFYNKTLKDIANRYQLLQGAKIDYTLGIIWYLLKRILNSWIDH
jgi:isoleucyl-tRNA synthetase